jgi:hypothetical protein
MDCPHGPEACQACRGGAEALRPELAPLRYSRLKLIGQSPAHYHAAVDKDTYPIERGRALHSLVLGGTRVIGYPGKVRAGKVWEAFQAEHAGKLILTGNDFAKTRAMADAVLRHPVAMQVLAGQCELEIDWTFMGRKCQSHLDALGPGGRIVGELKSTVSSNPDRFMWQAHRMGYFGQVAFYMDAVRAAGLGDPTDAYFVAVEATEPHVVSVMRVAEDALEMGRKTVRLWMERLLACEAANDWPGYVQGVVDLHAPSEDVELTFGDDDSAPAHDPVTGEVAA